MRAATYKRRRQKTLWFARACGISAWIPTAGMIDAAEERTQGMVALYMHHGARAQDLGVLVRSAYLQGAQDTAMIAARLQQGETFGIEGKHE